MDVLAGLDGRAVSGLVLEGMRGVGDGDKVRRHQTCALVDELVERVLAVGAGLAPEDLAGVGGGGRTIPAHTLAVGLHGELLQVGREAVEVLRVGKNGVALRAKEVGVPDVEQTHQRGNVLLEGGSAHVLVDGVEAGEELAPVVRADGNDNRGADGGVDRVAATHPVPEAEGVLGVDAEGGDLVERGGDGDEVLGDGILLGGIATVDSAGSFEPVPQPGARHTRVGQGLEGAESLRRDNKEGGLGVEAGGLFVDVGRVDVGDEAHLETGLDVGLECFVDHDGAEVGATDTDVDHGLDALAGDAGPLAGTDLLCEGVDLVEGGVHVGIDVLSVNNKTDGRHEVGAVFGAAERRVENRAVLGRVNVLAGDHGCVAARDVDVLRQLEQVRQDLFGDEALGEVDREVSCLEGVTVGAVGLGVEPAAEIGGETVSDAGEVLPGIGCGGVNGGGLGQNILLNAASVHGPRRPQ